MNAWATTIISGLVFVVAFMQWRTAHQKVVLDLFDRRLGVYKQLEQGIMEFSITRGANPHSLSKVRDAFLEAKFLFGSDVFSKIHQLVVQMESWERIALEVTMYEKSKADEMQLRQAAILSFADEFRASMPKLFERYMRMDQKLVRTPWQWLDDRNQMRLSYADEKQR
ncbi:hypothetical protein FVA81_23995 [Rhizobium sp. WL3]|uniref:hypothetical protein n=1 Tax=Rhizobium sp. WL3 TaxID=2603277 RepID=UPI0011C20A3B|nr:hypothetical protein [Rhizobium sp. WL3]QEE47478.1 hypothetical protein FVA81_23995 [Rhizobium sp. WL3]